MVTRDLARVVQSEEARRLEILTMEELRKYIAPRATESEIWIFMRYCVAEQLSPISGEVYLIKYSDDAPAAIQIGIAAVRKRAVRHVLYDGHDAGIVVIDKKGDMQFREGTMEYPDDKLMGGWCQVRMKGEVQSRLRHTVSLKEYDQEIRRPTKPGLWKYMKATLIAKVAESQGLRHAFPDVLPPPPGGVKVVLDAEVIEAEPLAIDAGKAPAVQTVDAKPITFVGTKIAPQTRKFQSVAHWSHAVENELGVNLKDALDILVVSRVDDVTDLSAAFRRLEDHLSKGA